MADERGQAFGRTVSFFEPLRLEGFGVWEAFGMLLFIGLQVGRDIRFLFFFSDCFRIERYVKAEALQRGIGIGALGRETVFFPKSEIRGIGIGVAILVFCEDEHIIRLWDASDRRDMERSIEAGRRFILGEHGELDVAILAISRLESRLREFCGIREIHPLLLETAEVILSTILVLMKEGSKAVFNLLALRAIEIVSPEAGAADALPLDLDSFPVDEERLEETETVIHSFRALSKNKIFFFHDRIISHDCSSCSFLTHTAVYSLIGALSISQFRSEVFWQLACSMSCLVYTLMSLIFGLIILAILATSLMVLSLAPICWSLATARAFRSS